MKFKLLFIFAVLAMVVSCKSTPKQKTYQDAEREFVSSLTSTDTLNCVFLCEQFMSLLKDQKVDDALDMLCVVYEDELYKVADSSLSEFKNRFEVFPVTDFQLQRFSFSTQAVNDVVFRYSSGCAINESGPHFKLVINPILIDDTWYLMLKDAYQSSKDLNANDQISPYAPVPAPVKLHVN